MPLSPFDDRDVMCFEKAEQGARANTTGCHGSCSEQHAPRQPVVWLTYDVRQKMNPKSTTSGLRPRCFLFLGALSISIAGCTSQYRSFATLGNPTEYSYHATS